jgi:hypothetical protein
MPSGFRPEDRERILRWLSHGVALARDLKGDRARNSDAIWLLFTEALDIFDRVPDQERSWLTSGLRSGGWSSVGLTLAEAREIERVRLHCGMKPYDGPAGRVIEAAAVDRALDVLCFMRWFGAYVKSDRVEAMQRATLALARGGDQEAFHRAWSPGRKLTRQGVAHFRQVVFGHVLAGLRNDLGIVPIGQLGFTATP